MTDEYEIAEEATPKPKARKTPDAITEMDLPWEADRYDVGDCALARRDGTEEYPFEGMSVWLSPYTPSSLNEAGMQFTASGGNRMGDAFRQLREGLAKVVVYHDIVDPSEAEPYAQWWHNPDAMLDAPSQLLFHVWSLVITGEAPGERPKGSPRGRGGTSTRASTARRSRS